MPNRITVFQEQKQLTENHPIRTGRIKIEGTLNPGEYELTLYPRISKKGNSYLGGFINPIQEKKEIKSFSEPKEPENNFNPGLDDSEIPF